MRPFILIAFAASLFASQAHGQCNNRRGPDIVPCPGPYERPERPVCDLNYEIYEVRGELYYWNQFMDPAAEPCEYEAPMFRASLHVGTDLNECLDYPCEDSDDAMCRHEVYIRPWFVWNIRSTENIAHQIDCSRRFFVARGCFVEGSDGRVFVADSIDYDRDALPRD